MKTIAVIILHYGLSSVTKKCINSLTEKDRALYEIIVVNNSDKTLSNKDFKGKRLVVINNQSNLGFSGGINIGIDYALGKNMDQILILNNDIEIIKPFIDKLSKTLEADISIGIVAPAIKFLKNGKKNYDIGGHLNKIFGRTSHKEVSSLRETMTQDVDYVSGAVMLVAREVFAKIGKFDDRFFLYYEDVDFCLRARKKGFKIVVEPHVEVFHLLSEAAGKGSSLAVYYQTRSAILFGKKYMRNFPDSLFHKIFLACQTILIVAKNPGVSSAAFRALFGISLIRNTPENN